MLLLILLALDDPDFLWTSMRISVAVSVLLVSFQEQIQASVTSMRRAEDRLSGGL